MSKNLNALDANDQVQFDHLSGTTDTSGFVGLSKVVFGADGSAPTRVVRDTSPLPVDTVVRATSADRGAIIGFTGATVTTTAGSTTVTLVAAPTSGSFLLGQQLVVAGAAFPAGTTIVSLASGSQGAAGSTYVTSAAAVSAVTAAAGTSVGPQQIMAANTARRAISYQVQSTTANVWVNGIAGATADYHSLRLFPATYTPSEPTHVGTGAVTAIADTPATPLYAREA